MSSATPNVSVAHQAGGLSTGPALNLACGGERNSIPPAQAAAERQQVVAKASSDLRLPGIFARCCRVGEPDKASALDNPLSLMPCWKKCEEPSRGRKEEFRTDDRRHFGGRLQVAWG